MNVLAIKSSGDHTSVSVILNDDINTYSMSHERKENLCIAENKREEAGERERMIKKGERNKGKERERERLID